MKFGTPSKAPSGSAFALNMPSGDVGTQDRPKKEPEPAGAYVQLAFAGQNPIVITGAQAKEALTWLTANAGKLVVPSA